MYALLYWPFLRLSPSHTCHRRTSCRRLPKLPPGIEQLRRQRHELVTEIAREEEDKAKVEHDLRILNERLAQIDGSLDKKYAARREFDTLISETEANFSRILESSQTLLDVVKRDSVHLCSSTGSGMASRSTRSGHQSARDGPSAHYSHKSSSHYRS